MNMEKTILGKTGLSVGRTGLGCIPIQRVTDEESTALLRRAYDGGVTLFDTANAYTTSEGKIGLALSGIRDKIILCTKSMAATPEALVAQLDNSLTMMKTDYVDVFQFHNPAKAFVPGGEDGMYDTMAGLVKAGKVRHIGITAHKRAVAEEAVASGNYATLQFPFSYLSTPEEMKLVALCREHNVGILGMKALAGGIITNAKAAFAFLRPHDNIVPIWGIQTMEQLNEILSYEENPPLLDAAMQQAIGTDRAELAGNFCRSCNYCAPCPAGIPIFNAARMKFLLRRMNAATFQTPEWQAHMRRVDECTNCGQCSAKCPYGLNVPELLKINQEDYFDILPKE
jgi:aryl-alcohol dehydrogenase-like predicted oxidoreductase